MQIIEHTMVSTIIAQLISGASYSIKFALNQDLKSHHIGNRLPEGEIYILPDTRLDLRSITRFPFELEDLTETEDLILNTYIKGIEAPGWQARIAPGVQFQDFLLVDDEAVLVCDQGGMVRKSCVYLSFDKQQLRHYTSLFDNLWNRSSRIELIYQSYREINDLLAEKQLIIISDEIWTTFINRLIRNPKELHSLNSIQFEEFVAELLRRDGLSVTLTPRSRDGGKDIFAVANTPVGKHMYYVECKKYAPGRPVDVRLVRQLYGVIEADRATAGMLVTTSAFTKDAKRFASTLGYRLSLKDYSGIVIWMKEHGNAH